ncbi:MAG: superoxide dismutase family protein [Clostridia bacterium]|nr:superoxide dismutase family protein [Clostridia bacterium]
MENKFINYKPFFAIAKIKGGNMYPNINGTVTFKRKDDGVLVTAEIWGLPYKTDKCNDEIFAFHIHNGNSCTGNMMDSFANAGTHYNPNNCKHPEHAGDLPPLFGNNGYAYLSTYTNRFSIDEIIGKVIIIHDKPDDFTSQPSGNSGNKIACGKILPF